MPDIRLPVAVLGYHPTRKRDIGRPRRRWVPEHVWGHYSWSGDDDDEKLFPILHILYVDS